MTKQDKEWLIMLAYTCVNILAYLIDGHSWRLEQESRKEELWRLADIK